MEFLYISKEINGLSDLILSHWFPQEDRAMKEVWEGHGLDKRRCDLAWDVDVPPLATLMLTLPPPLPIYFYNNIQESLHIIPYLLHHRM